MELISINNLVQYDNEKDIIGHYSQDVLDMILDCLSNQDKLDEINHKFIVGDATLEKYIAYFNKLKHYFSLNVNIAEFGYGIFPIMSYLIDNEQQKLKRGTITAYETEDSVKIKLGKISFRYSSIRPEIYHELKDIDLLFGIYPCCSSFDMIDAANFLGIDFFLVMCDCPPFYGDYHELYKYAQKGIDSSSELIVDTEIYKLTPIIIKRKKSLHV